MTYDLNVTKVVGVLPAVDDLALERVALTANHAVYDERGEQLSGIGTLVSEILRDSRVPEGMRMGDESHRYFVFEAGVPRSRSRGRLFVLKLQPESYALSTK